MTNTKHSISIGIERFDNTLYIALKAVGKLTHADYEAFTPMLEGALASVESPDVKVLFDATEFEGWELRAAWDDINIGLSHRNEFNKIAIVGGKDWQALLARIGNWFVSGEVNYFEEPRAAINWLCV